MIHDCGMRSIPSLTSIIFECQLPVHLNLLIFVLDSLASWQVTCQSEDAWNRQVVDCFLNRNFGERALQKKWDMIANRLTGHWTLLKDLPLKNTLQETNISVENGPFDHVMIFCYHGHNRDSVSTVQLDHPWSSSPRIWCKSKAANTSSPASKDLCLGWNLANNPSKFRLQCWSDSRWWLVSTSPQPWWKKLHEFKPPWVSVTLGCRWKQAPWGRNLMNSRVERLKLLQHGLVHQT